MKEQYVSRLVEGERVDSVFAIRAKELRTARTGEAYLYLILADRTGSIPAVKFRPDPVSDAPPVGSVIRALGRVTTFRGVHRVSVEQLRPAESFDRHDLLPGPRRDPEEALRELRRLVAGVHDAALRSLLGAVFGDAGFLARFLESPATRDGHHAYLGGLAEHTLAVSSVASHLATLYPQADRDLLVSAALLHDVGVVDELSCDVGIGVTDAGRLLGHAVLTERRVRDALSKASSALDTARCDRLSHALLSHHVDAVAPSKAGPSTLEALLLAEADATETRASGFIESTDGAAMVQERWTDDANAFRRPLYTPASAGGRERGAEHAVPQLRSA